MIKLKILCLSFLIAGVFTSCSFGQNKSDTPPMTRVEAPKSSKFNEETQRFESIEGKFTINIPQAPSQTQDLGTETANKKGVDVGKLFAWQFPEKAIYTIMYKNAFDSNGNAFQPDGDPKSQKARDLEALNAGMRRGIANNNIKLISEKSITFNSEPGTEFRYISADGVKFIGRIYLINSVGYQIVGGYQDDNYEKEILKVLDSFEVIK